MSGSCGWFPLPYDEILAWVEQHRDSLPTTLAELSAYPIAFRKVIVNYVPHEQRSRFWQDHLRTFLEGDADLNGEQRAFVEELIDGFPDLFAHPLAEFQVRMRPMGQRMATLFTRAQAHAMFGTCGRAEPPEGLPIPPGTRLTPIA